MNDTMTKDERAALVAARLEAVENSGIAQVLGAINTRHYPRLVARVRPVIDDRGQSTSAKTRALYDALEPLTQEVGKLAACRKGCSHCCHIAVAINQAEADLIARKTHIPAAKPDNRMLEGRQTFADAIALGYAHPCPFLVDGACSVYDVRPLACRTQFNMDIDAELCRLDQGSNRVPLYKTTDIDMIGVMAAGGPHKVTIADIREFFPNVTAGRVAHAQAAAGDQP
jgi:Fe-S-cluster containining protein